MVGVSAISCWEIAKLVEYGRLELPTSLDEWFDQALDYPGVQLLALTPEIAIESTRFPATFIVILLTRSLSPRHKCMGARL